MFKDFQVSLQGKIIEGVTEFKYKRKPELFEFYYHRGGKIFFRNEHKKISMTLTKLEKDNFLKQVKLHQEIEIDFNHL